MRLASLSLHTSPLLQAGSGDAGGMNVYVRELMSAVARTGVDVTVYTRAWRAGLAPEVVVEPGYTVVHVEAGPYDLPKESLPDIVPLFADGVARHLASTAPVHALHGNYWLSGLAGHQLKHELDVPLVMTFHTLARVKAEGGDHEPEGRVRSETDIIGCTDAVCVSCDEEQRQFRHLYGQPPGRLEIVAPGVDHAFFAPGDRGGARHALGLGDHPVLLFVGRIQPLKGVDVAVKTLASLHRPDAVLLIVGGASGADGDGEVAKLHELIDRLGVRKQVRFVAPQPHHILATYYRAADLVLVPSRSESFGLVALEAAACGTPVVASAVGGLLTLVDHGRTGFLVPGRDPDVFAGYCAEVLDHPVLALDMAMSAAERARRYTWSAAAHRLGGLYQDLRVGSLVACS